MTDSALVIVDMLHDFIDGSLACLNAGNAITAALKFLDRNMSAQEGDGSLEILDTFPVLFVRDHHPADHSSFKDYGGIWPPHCVAGTHGAEVCPELEPYRIDELTFDKGCDRDVEQYSGIEAVNNAGQTVAEILEMLDIKEVYVCGIATEYCVLNTASDLKNAGFDVKVIKDALAYVDRQGHEDALEQMTGMGIKLV